MQPRSVSTGEQVLTPRVSATLILDQTELIASLHGREVVDQALAALDPADRFQLETLVRGGWCSVEAARHFKTAVAYEVGEKPLVFQRRIVRIGLERTLGGVWRVFLALISDARLSQGATLIYSRSFDRGQLRLVTLREHGCDLELLGWPEIDDFDLAGLTAGVEAAFSLAKRKNIEVKTTRVDDRVLVEARWSR